MKNLTCILFANRLVYAALSDGQAVTKEFATTLDVVEASKKVTNRPFVVTDKLSDSEKNDIFNACSRARVYPVYIKTKQLDGAIKALYAQLFDTAPSETEATPTEEKTPVKIDTTPQLLRETQLDKPRYVVFTSKDESRKVLVEMAVTEKQYKANLNKMGKARTEKVLVNGTGGGRYWTTVEKPAEPMFRTWKEYTFTCTNVMLVHSAAKALAVLFEEKGITSLEVYSNNINYINRVKAGARRQVQVPRVNPRTQEPYMSTQNLVLIPHVASEMAKGEFKSALEQAIAISKLLTPEMTFEQALAVLNKVNTPKPQRKRASTDPFVDDNAKVLENGNSLPKELPPVQPTKKARKPRAKTCPQCKNLYESCTC